MQKTKLHSTLTIAISAVIAFMLILTNIGVSTLHAASGTQEITLEKIEFKAPTDNNPLGGAADFNGIIFGNLQNFADTEGSVASIGKVAVQSVGYKVSDGTYPSHAPNWIPGDAIDDGKIPQMNIGLLLGGMGNSSTTVSQGSVLLGVNGAVFTGSIYTNNGEIVTKSSKADTFMQDAYNALSAKNLELSNIEANGTETRQAGNSVLSKYKSASSDIILFEGDDPNWNIFEVDLSDDYYSKSAWVFDVPEGSAILMQVVKPAGSSEVTLTNGTNSYMNVVSGSTWTPSLLYSDGTLHGATAEFAGRVLWNIDPAIEKVNCRAGTNYLMGSVLAPDAEMFTLGAGDNSINGTLVAKSANGAGGSELHWFKFRGPTGENTEDAVTTTTAATTTTTTTKVTTTTTSTTTTTTVTSVTTPGTTVIPGTTPTTTNPDGGEVVPNPGDPSVTTIQPGTTTTAGGTTPPVGTTKPTGTTAPEGTTTTKPDNSNTTPVSGDGTVTTSVTTPLVSGEDGIGPNPPPTSKIELGAGVTEEAGEQNSGLPYMIAVFAIGAVGMLTIKLVKKAK